MKDCTSSGSIDSQISSINFLVLLKMNSIVHQLALNDDQTSSINFSMLLKMKSCTSDMLLLMIDYHESTVCADEDGKTVDH